MVPELHPHPNLVKVQQQQAKEMLRPQKASSFDMIPQGQAFFDELKQGIDTAQKSVRMQFFIYGVDKKVGGPIFEALKNAALRGVKVEIVFDHTFGLGNFWNFPKLKRTLKDLNALKGQDGQPLVTLKKATEKRETKQAQVKEWFAEIVEKDHTKNVIIDAELPEKAVAYIGGRNMWDKDVENDDFMVRVRGDMVQYNRSDLERTMKGRDRPDIYRDKDGNELVSDVRGTDKIPDRLIQEIRTAKKRIWLQTPYFDPFHLTKELIAAKKLNPELDIRIVMPKPLNNNHFIIFGILYPFYIKRLEDAGIQVHKYNKADKWYNWNILKRKKMHAKAALFDDLAAVGSSNLSKTAIISGQNGEIELFTRDPDFRQQLEAWFDDEFAQTKNPANEGSPVMKLHSQTNATEQTHSLVAPLTGKQEIIPSMPEFYQELLSRIGHAKSSITIQADRLYNDHVGSYIYRALEEAAKKRGITVRIHIGQKWSANLPASLATVDEYHKLRNSIMGGNMSMEKSKKTGLTSIVIDGDLTAQDAVAYIGTGNITDSDAGWENFMVRVQGQDVYKIKEEMERPARKERQKKEHLPQQVLQSIQNAKKRVWVQLPYVDRHLRQELVELKKKSPKIDIQYIIPEYQLHKMLSFRWKHPLEHAGIQVLGYRGIQKGEVISESQAILVDDEAMVGREMSGNTDLVESLKAWFEDDKKHSKRYI